MPDVLFRGQLVITEHSAIGQRDIVAAHRFADWTGLRHRDHSGFGFLLGYVVLKRLSHAQVANHCIVCNLSSILCGHAIGDDLFEQRRIVLFFGRELVGINVLEDFLVC